MWGITLKQFGALLTHAQEDASWRSDCTMYDFVNQYVKPATAGRGVGYAVLVNENDPLEVNVMISHAWMENAEEFYAILSRTVTAHDVMFICALSLYQNEDGYGPSIAQQLGQVATESPFRRVLENIRKRHTRVVNSIPKLFKLLEVLPGILVVMSVTFLAIVSLRHECIPLWSNDCANLQELCFYPLNWFDETLVALSMFSLLNVFLAICLERLLDARGRMVVTPNMNAAIYTRLWCVYEIFTARILNVRVKLAKTLAPVWHGDRQTSPSCEAFCGSPKDEDRIRAEIEERGVAQTGIPEAGYDEVDHHIFRTQAVVRSQTVIGFTQLWLLQVALSLIEEYVDPEIHVDLAWQQGVPLELARGLLIAVYMLVTYKVVTKSNGTISFLALWLMASPYFLVYVVSLIVLSIVPKETATFLVFLIILAVTSRKICYSYAIAGLYFLFEQCWPCLRIWGPRATLCIIALVAFLAKVDSTLKDIADHSTTISNADALPKCVPFNNRDRVSVVCAVIIYAAVATFFNLSFALVACWVFETWGIRIVFCHSNASPSHANTDACNDRDSEAFSSDNESTTSLLRESEDSM